MTQEQNNIIAEVRKVFPEYVAEEILFLEHKPNCYCEGCSNLPNEDGVLCQSCIELLREAFKKYK